MNKNNCRLKKAITIAEALFEGFIGDFEDRLHDEFCLKTGCSFRFYNGAYIITYAGISGSSTFSRGQALRSWIRAAKRKLEAL